MRYFFLPLFFSSLCLAVETPISGIIKGQALAGNDSETATASSPPNPGKLTADWWRYFDAEPGVLKDRIDIAIRHLNEALQALPEDDKQVASARIKRITENLRILLDARKNPGPEAPTARRPQDRYTLDEWLEVAHKRRTIQAELQSEQEDLQRNERHVNAAQQGLDSMTAAYLALPEQSHGKAVQGLAVMAGWSDLALNGKRLRLKKAALSLHKAQEQQLIEDNAAARERLFVGADDLLRIGQEIEAAERELNTAREEASRLATAPMPSDFDTEEGKTRSLLFEQRLRHATIKEAMADAVLTREKIERDLAHSLSAKTDTRPEGLRERLQDNLDHMGEISARIELWREDAEQDQGAGRASPWLPCSALQAKRIANSLHSPNNVSPMYRIRCFHCNGWMAKSMTLK